MTTLDKIKQALAVLAKSDSGKISPYGMPNGFFFKDLLWFGEPASTQVAVSRGFYIEAPEQSTMDESMLAHLSDRLRQIGGTLGREYTMQVKHSVGRDYRDILRMFNEETQAINGFDWQMWNRSERYHRYWDAMEAGKLRRERLAVFFTRVIPNQLEFSLSEVAMAKHFEAMAEREADTFARVHGSALNTHFPDCQIIPMRDKEHFEFYYRFLNPSQEIKFELEVEPSFSIQDNCLLGCITQNGTPGTSFQLDGYHNIILVMQDLPRQIEAGMITRLLTDKFVDFEVTVNIYPQQTNEVIKRIENANADVEGEVSTRAKERHSLGTQTRMAARKIEELEEGHVNPVNVMLIMRLWSADYSELISRAAIAKNAFGAMSGSVAYHATNAETARQLWFNTWPGWTYSNYRAWDITTDDQTAAELLPWNSSFTGRMDAPEMLYDSPSGGLVGISTQISDTPQNILMVGVTGAGKSILLADMLAQFLHRFHYCLIADEGMSHGITVRTAGGTSLVLSPGGNLTINYLDPGELPLTAEHIAFCVALCLQMLGQDRSDKERWSEVQAVVTRHINIAFDASFQEWEAKDPTEAARIAALAYMTHQHWKMMPEGSTFLDAWQDESFQDNGFYLNPDPLEVAKFSTHHQTHHFVRDLSFAFMRPDDMPTHTELVEIMTLTPDSGTAANPSAVSIGKRLRTWCSDGVYGKLFDGKTNVNLNASMVHFEFNKIPAAREEMREVAYFLITNVMMQQVIKRPRAERKLFIFEEAARMIALPGGGETLKLLYTQMRKYNGLVIAAFQQLSAFAVADPSVRSAVVDNTKLFLISAQPSVAAAREIAQALNLTEAVEKQIQMLPQVEHQTGQKFSSWIMVAPGARRQLVGPFINVASPELIYCAISNTKVFDERAKALSKYDNVVTGILEEARK